MPSAQRFYDLNNNRHGPSEEKLWAATRNEHVMNAFMSDCSSMNCEFLKIPSTVHLGKFTGLNVLQLTVNCVLLFEHNE